MSATTGVPFISFIGVNLHKVIVTLCAVDPAELPILPLTCDTKFVDRINNWMLAVPRPSDVAVERPTVRVIASERRYQSAHD